LLTRSLLVRISLAGGATALATLGLVMWQGGSDDHARWLAFNALVLGQLVRAYSNRSLVHPVTTLAPNRFLAAACIGAALVQFAIPFVPPLADAFRATPLDAFEIVAIALIALGPALAAELIRRRRASTWVA
jgi:magnesium-transporting ATPase (P-type)